MGIGRGRGAGCREQGGEFKLPLSPLAALVYLPRLNQKLIFMTKPLEKLAIYT